MASGKTLKLRELTEQHPVIRPGTNRQTGELLDPSMASARPKGVHARRGFKNKAEQYRFLVSRNRFKGVRKDVAKTKRAVRKQPG